MSITTKHETVKPSMTPSDHWVETVEGSTPNSAEIALNAKGAAQFTVKLYYASPSDMRLAVADELAAIINQVKIALDAAGIPLAGQNGASATEGK